MRFKGMERNKIKRMHKMFEEMHELYNELSDDTKEKILDFHNETATLPYCIRWGYQATDELLG